jgi:pimeloyl-ACP methyl ester carboxylesterase
MMKKIILSTALMLATFVLEYAQMDDKFYHPDKQWLSTDSLPCEMIVFSTADGDTLHSLFVKPEVHVKGTVIYFHGNGGNTSKWAGHIMPLVRDGFQVCLFDYRGYGKSTGTPTHMNIASDARLWMDSLLRRDDVKSTKIVIYGASIGTQVATLIAREYNSRIVALAVDGMPASFTDVALASSPAEQHEVIKKYVTSPYSARENFRHIAGIKVLFIHSPEDFIPIAQAEEIYGSTGCEKQFWKYSGDHIKAPLLYPDMFVEHINWLIR